MSTVQIVSHSSHPMLFLTLYLNADHIVLNATMLKRNKILNPSCLALAILTVWPCTKLALRTKLLRTFATGWPAANIAGSRLQRLRIYSSICEPILKLEASLLCHTRNQHVMYTAVRASSGQVRCSRVSTRLDIGHITTSHPYSPFRQQVVILRPIHCTDTTLIEFSNNCGTRRSWRLPAMTIDICVA